MPDSRARITALLKDWREGNAEAFSRLLPIVYDELRHLAGRQIQNERADHTLQPTALVHEAYLRLVDTEVAWEDRAHFLAVAARSMRRVLVDHARARKAAKRGGAAPHTDLVEELVGGAPDKDLVALDAALVELMEKDPRSVRAIELHYFAGLSYEETAKVLEVSPATVHRDLRMARAWLLVRLAGDDSDA